jgi:hypothetical protein
MRPTRRGAAFVPSIASLFFLENLFSAVSIAVVSKRSVPVVSGGRSRQPLLHFSSKYSSVPSPSYVDCPGNLSVIGLTKRVYQGFFDMIAAAIFMMND